MSASDDIDYGYCDVMSREEEWQAGFHTTREGDEIELIKMTSDHLMNTINYFKNSDTLPLRRELERRCKIEITDYRI